MPRKPRTQRQEISDVFCDLPVDEQKVTLELLSELHRQAVRQRKRQWEAPPNGAGLYETDEEKSS